MLLNKIKIFLYFCLFFLLGVLSVFIFDYSVITGRAVYAPQDSVKVKDMIAYEDKVVIYIDNAVINSYSASDSMLPFFGSDANGISVKPSSPEEINIGDIITFREGEKMLAHRVIKKGADAEGIYFITKGDNKNFSDKKIRFEKIEYKLIGIIY